VRVAVGQESVTVVVPVDKKCGITSNSSWVVQSAPCTLGWPGMARRSPLLHEAWFRSSLRTSGEVQCCRQCACSSLVQISPSSVSVGGKANNVFVVQQNTWGCEQGARLPAQPDGVCDAPRPKDPTHEAPAPHARAEEPSLPEPHGRQQLRHFLPLLLRISCVCHN